MYGGQNSVPLTSLEHQLWARPLPEELQAVGERVYYTRTRLVSHKQGWDGHMGTRGRSEAAAPGRRHLPPRSLQGEGSGQGTEQGERVCSHGASPDGQQD